MLAVGAQVLVSSEAGLLHSSTVRQHANGYYEVEIDASTLGLAPGRYEAGLRYIAYRARSDGAEWLGVAESDTVPFEVPPK